MEKIIAYDPVLHDIDVSFLFFFFPLSDFNFNFKLTSWMSTINQSKALHILIFPLNIIRVLFLIQTINHKLAFCYNNKK